MKKYFLFFIFLFVLVVHKMEAQQTYCDFDGIKVINFGTSTGVIDTLFPNPFPDNTDSSIYCAKYIRDTTLFDYFKMYSHKKLIDITPYASNTFQTPKIKMKLYSSAPVGTIVELQLGLKSVDNYPAGIHSEYIAATTVQNAWQDLIFNYFQSPPGSLAAPTDIEKIVILFHPNSHDRDTIYFDDIVGPELFYTGINAVDDLLPFKLYQNIPNPAKENTLINFQLHSSGLVDLKIYDLLGNTILSSLQSYMISGNYSIPLETSSIPNGIYFYVLKKGTSSQTMKMIIAN